MSIGDALTGIATGYISEALRDSRQADQERYDRIKLAENQYYNVDLPNYKREEKLRDANIAYINAELGPVYANYFDAQGITLDSTNTRSFVKQFKDAGFSETEKLEIESTITGRRKERQEDLDEKLAMIRDRESRKSGGIGDNIAKMFFSKDEEDISKVGVKQGTDMEAPPQDTFTPISELLGTTGNKFDFNNMNHRAAAGDVESRFSRFFQDPENFDVYDFSSRPDLTADYQSYKDAGYKGSEIEFAFQKFMEENLATPEFGGLEYTGGYRAFDEKVAANRQQKEIKANVGDDKKFDQDTSIDFRDETVSKDPKVDNATGVINFDETNAIMKEAREARSAILNDANLSESEKERRMNILRNQVKKDIEATGADPNRFRIL
jgi:hypothetical protein